MINYKNTVENTQSCIMPLYFSQSQAFLLTENESSGFIAF